jgi:hypothetical protein
MPRTTINSARVRTVLSQHGIGRHGAPHGTLTRCGCVVCILAAAAGVSAASLAALMDRSSRLDAVHARHLAQREIDGVLFHAYGLGTRDTEWLLTATADIHAAQARYVAALDVVAAIERGDAEPLVHAAEFL